MRTKRGWCSPPERCSQHSRPGYATAFSTFYLPLLVILGALIVRGLAFEFRGKKDDEQWRRRWDRCIVVGSIVVPVVWGTFFANLVRGLPIDAAG